jgi:ABC-type multidrug transport system, ATPase component
MDEPTSDLDPRARRNFIAFLQRLDHAMLIATHDLDMALECCTRVIVLDGGHIVGRVRFPACLVMNPF